MSEIRFNNTAIELRESNAYSDGSLVQFSNGEQELERKVVEWEGNENDRYYTVRIDDYLDKIAYKAYNDVVDKPEFYWWVIADANLIDNPMDISEFVGKDLIIPDIQIFLLTKESNA